MTKSKSFKKLSDLKDLDLFKAELDPSKQNDLQNLAPKAKIQVEQSQSTAATRGITQVNPAPIYGTQDQEASYQVRLDWLNKRERDLSLLESEFSRIKKSLDDEKQQLIVQRQLIADEQKAHENRLSKLNEIDDLEKKVSIKADFLNDLNAALDKKAHALLAQEKKVKNDLSTANTQIKKALSEAASASLKIESRDKKIDALKRDLLAEASQKNNAEAKLAQSRKELAASSKIIRKLENQIAEFDAPHNIKLDIWDFVEFITTNGATAVELGYKNKKIAICGDSPWDNKDFIKFLKTKGFTPVTTFNSDAEVAVVGRDFDSEVVEGQLVAREGKKIHFYSQELLIATIASGINPLDNPRPYKDLLQEFSKDHPGLLFLQDGFEFPWPLPNISDIPPLVYLGDSSAEISPLRSVGYTVGKVRGLDIATRRKILQNAFYGAYDDTEEWYVESDEYMKRWGRPRSRTRLFQMSNHIRNLIITRRGIPSMSQAAEEWEDDLRWLKKFYKPHMSFKWPVLD